MDEKLMMVIGLVDQVTKPLAGITNEINGAMSAAEKGMEQAAKGGAGLWATGVAIQNALMPAIEMDRKLGEVKSLGVTDEALKQLQQTALEFASDYGKSATEFVGASYDIQSAIAGLTGEELSQFTKASGVLAAATKADTATITSYMGTMYGIFKNQAEEMGKAAWVEDVAGMTASAVQMFKTTGMEMSSAFTSVGANATAAGIAMSEQMAILGTLQSTMSGSEAGTKYKAFLAGVGGAQDKLNLSFVDAQGKMLPMLDILEKLQGKFGDTLDVAESDELKKAFGSDEAVSLIKLLMADTQGLAASIDSLGQTKGMGKAEQMAAAMTDQSQRLEASWFAIRAAAFSMVLPAFNAVTGSIADGLMWLTSMTSEYPVLTEVLSYAAIGALSLGGVVASLSLVMGIAKMMAGGWAVTMGTLSAALKIMSVATQALTLKSWLLNAAFWANPITWLVVGIGAAAAAIWIFQDYIGAFLSGFIDGFIEASGVTVLFQPLLQLFGLIGDAIGWVFGWLIQLFTPIDAASESLLGFASAGQLVGAIIGSVFRGILMPIEVVMTAIKQFISLINKIPGIDIDFDASVEQAVKVADAAGVSISEEPQIANSTLIDYKRPENTPQLSKNMVNNLNSSESRTTHNVRQYGDVYITPQGGMTPEQLAEWDELNAG
ncbi:phage tail tape measure protein [Vibrio cholerae]|uniref:phage tail tape measure protein n=2 Tax=Vibrio cholerae TaxID=666 RepID=UPI002934FAF1|nr:phage tail tape measure protein [Vibrio cholerae]MDV2385701.1 phage tail tape measure protein [Vibrio cholerae]